MALVALLSAFIVLSVVSAGVAEEEIKVHPSPIVVEIGQTLSVRVEIHPIHKRCPVPIEQTGVTLPEGIVEVVDAGKWTVADDYYYCVIKIRGVKAVEGQLIVERPCPIYGSLKLSIPVVVAEKEQASALGEAAASAGSSTSA